MRPFLSDRGWSFEVATGELWDRLSSVEEYRSWWPWLRRFDPDGGFAVGASWRCEVTPPLPYVVRFTVRLEEIEVGRAVRATVDGDVSGVAELDVRAVGADASSARLRSALLPANPLLRSVGRLARPAVEWGHDWVLDQGRRQFVDRGL